MQELLLCLDGGTAFLYAGLRISGKMMATLNKILVEVGRSWSKRSLGLVTVVGLCGPVLDIKV